MNLKQICFIFPLDHPLTWTADFQSQTIQLVRTSSYSRLLLYHAYSPRKTWKDLFSIGYWHSTFTSLKDAKETKILNAHPMHLIPFERFTQIYHLNLKLSILFAILTAAAVFQTNTFVSWIFHPRFAVIHTLLGKIFFLKSKTLYDCVDYLSFNNSNEEQCIRHQEINLLKQANLVSVNSSTLLEKHQLTAATIKLFPAGFREDQFKSEKRFSALQSKPINILFVGGLNYRVDLKTIFQLANKHPSWNFNLVGPIYPDETGSVDKTTQHMNQLRHLTNVSHHDYIKPEQLPRFYLSTTIGIIPYDMSVPISRFCNPLKLQEYMYFGIPVVASDIPALSDTKTPFIKVASSISEWESAITFFLKHPPVKKDQAQMRAIALSNSSNKKVSMILSELL